jgi:hypothetical protein
MEKHNSCCSSSQQQPTASLLYTVANKEVEQQFSVCVWGERGGVTLPGTGGTCNHYSLNVNILGKAAMLYFALTLFCGWGRANSACRLLDIAVLMSGSHRLLIFCSPQRGVQRFSQAEVVCVVALRTESGKLI